MDERLRKEIIGEAERIISSAFRSNNCFEIKNENGLNCKNLSPSHECVMCENTLVYIIQRLDDVLKKIGSKSVTHPGNESNSLQDESISISENAGIDRERVECTICGASLSPKNLQKHLHRIHNTQRTSVKNNFNRGLLMLGARQALSDARKPKKVKKKTNKKIDKKSLAPLPINKNDKPSKVDKKPSSAGFGCKDGFIYVTRRRKFD